MSEYYAIKRYALDCVGCQLYAKDKNNNEIYLNIGTENDKHEVLAKTNENKIRYAKDCRGDFILPIRDSKPYYFFDSSGPVFPMKDDRVYGKWNNCEIYPNDGTTDFYLTDSDGNQCYAKNTKGRLYYASRMINNHLVQFYAKDKHNQDIFIYEGDVVYLLNITLNKPIYNMVQDKEEYIKMNGKEIYGRNLQSLPVYAKDKGEEYLATDHVPYYANYKNTEFYPKLSNKRQFYRKINQKEMYAFRDENKQYYAKNEQRDDILALDDAPYYCQDLKTEIYPKTKDNDQFYKIQNQVEIPAVNEKNLAYYAQKNTGNLFYPIDYSEG